MLRIFRRYGVATTILSFGAFGAFGAGCGPSPETAATAEAAKSGTLVVVIVTGPDRVPFRPKVDRIRRANEQLTAILGHSIQIELDGSLLPQDHDGAEDLIASLVENAARDLDALAKEDKDKKALAFARASFERLVVRYAPAEAAAREDRWSRNTGARLDPSSKTIDVVRAEARWVALDRGDIARTLYRAFAASQDDRYAHVSVDALPRGERSAWFDYHVHGAHNPDAKKYPPFTIVGSLNTIVVRGMITLHSLCNRDGDVELAKEARKWLIESGSSDFAQIYHHHVEVEAAPAQSPFKEAERAYVQWLNAEMPRMSIEEKAKVAEHLWVIDFRTPSNERDRFASYAFPGIDLMAFSFETVDAWIAAGHPPLRGANRDESRRVPALFDHVVCPATQEVRDGQLHYSHPGRCEGTFYQWALATKAREDVLVKNMLARPDPLFGQSAFYNARRALREEADYLRFLRRFEGSPVLWRAGADVHREVVYRPSPALLDEARRYWRDVPIARAHALLWFGRHTESSYHPDSDWPDLIQDKPADDATLRAYLDLGWDAFEILPAAWPGVAKSGSRMRVVTERAEKQLAANNQPRSGGPRVASVLVSLARLLCEDRSTSSEAAELRAFAQAQLPKWPGAGLSDVLEATDPTKDCKPKEHPAGTKPKRTTKPPSRRAPGSEGKP